MANRWGNSGNSGNSGWLYLGGAPKSLQMVIAAMKLKDTYSLKESYDQPRQHIQKQRHYFVNKGPSSQSYGFSCGHVWMWELDISGRNVKLQLLLKAVWQCWNKFVKTAWIHLYELPRIGKSEKMQIRNYQELKCLGVTWIYCQWLQSLCLGDKCFGNSCDGCMTLWIWLISLNYTFKMIKIASFIYFYSKNFNWCILI